ncbi:MAG TPA: hypothetical protein VNN62_02595 [Methylomirabilota bacterium]|jgi:hypothetical protein|nr:hypothetical protein [Methylomirabilota bacterium]
MKKTKPTQDAILRAWVKAPERWQQLWDVCEKGAGRYTHGLFVLYGRRPAPPKKTQGQLIADLLRSEPMGYLS